MEKSVIGVTVCTWQMRLKVCYYVAAILSETDIWDSVITHSGMQRGSLF